MRETWYVLEDGTYGDPKDVAPGQKGCLVHKNGLAVKMRAPDVPLTSGVDVDEHGKQMFAGKGDHDNSGKIGGSAAPPEAPPKVTAEMTPAEPPPRGKKSGYKIR